MMIGCRIDFFCLALRLQFQHKGRPPQHQQNVQQPAELRQEAHRAGHLVRRRLAHQQRRALVLVRVARFDLRARFAAPARRAPGDAAGADPEPRPLAALSPVKVREHACPAG